MDGEGAVWALRKVDDMMLPALAPPAQVPRHTRLQSLQRRHASGFLLREDHAAYASSIEQHRGVLKRRCLRSERASITCRAATGIVPSKRKQAAPGKKPSQRAPPLPKPAEYQQTLRKSFTVGGIGLHTGEYAFVRVKPACPGEGRYFVRVPEGTNSELFQVDPPQRLTAEEVDAFPSDDLSEDVRTGLFMDFIRAQEERGFEGTFADYLEELRDAEEAAELAEQQAQQEDEEAVPRSDGEGGYLPANISRVEQQHEWTTILGSGELNSVMCAEHLLAALEACGVDNARIEIEGGSEVPIVDGSALGWVVEIQRVGLRPAGALLVEAGDGGAAGEAEVVERAPRTAPVPIQSVMVQDGDSFVAFFPGPTTRLSVGVDQESVAPVIGRQWFSWVPEVDEHFRWEVAPARTYFASADEVLEMVQRGELRGGPDYCSLVAYGEAWDDEDMLRFPWDEPSRHAMLDLLGILSLGARPGHRGMPVGHVVAYCASHDLQLRFVRELQRICGQGPEYCDHIIVGC